MYSFYGRFSEWWVLSKPIVVVVFETWCVHGNCFCWICPDNSLIIGSFDLYTTNLLLYIGSFDLYTTNLLLYIGSFDLYTTNLLLYIGSFDLYTTNLLLYIGSFDLYTTNFLLYNFPCTSVPLLSVSAYCFIVFCLFVNLCVGQSKNSVHVYST